MINFRVHDLDAMVAQLRRSGIDVEVDPQFYPNGGWRSSKTLKATQFNYVSRCLGGRDGRSSIELPMELCRLQAL